MAKICSKDGCSFPVWSHDFCRFHQYLRVDQKKPKGLKPRKKTGERDLFLEIWQERPHVCNRCGEKLHEFSTSLFHHIRPKGRYPELRLDKDNIELICFYCHYKEHNFAKGDKTTGNIT